MGTSPPSSLPLISLPHNTNTQHVLAHKIEAAVEEERKVMDLLEIAQRVSDNLDDFGVLLAEAAAVLQLQQQPTAEATDPAGRGRDRFVDCAPELGIQERGETWLNWSIHRRRTFVAEVTAETWLSSAISDAQIALRQHRIYKELPSLSPGERARETWKVEEIVSTAINEVDAMSVAVRQMRVAVEEHAVREAIDDAAP
ncbi:hypothetical protein OsI_12088 [Oryza sativa Indica Group]|uniref:Uncharacterized protein n=1 Tax=Oryza sativa subsp. indica TaxID=39946 RepID=B8AK35_ORYSI|nr:hypothetical protein OsI_12088 [Oryza sativa Indica Group]